MTEEAKNNQQNMEINIIDSKRFIRRPSFKEIHDEIEMLMAEHTEELCIQDPDILKQVAHGESKEALTKAYEQASKLSASVQIARVLNLLIETFFEKKFNESDDLKLISETMKKHNQPIARILKTISAFQEPEGSLLKRNVVDMFGLLQAEEEEEFISTMVKLFP